MAEEYEMTQKEKEELIKLCKETTAIYKFMETAKLGLDWKGDTERFMAFTAAHTKNLIKHSIDLTRLTKWLIRLTIILGIIAIVQILLLFSRGLQ